MSTCKSSKTELVAIYRLEFYKKQKNWKLYSSRHNKKCPKKSVVEKHILNTTYNVDERPEKEASDPLNVAFVESESDDPNKSNEPTNSMELSQIWQEPVNIWPKSYQIESISKEHLQNNQLTINAVSIEKPNVHCATQRLQELVKAAELQEWGDTEQQDNAQNILKESELCKENYEYQTNAWSDDVARLDCNWRDNYFCEDIDVEEKWQIQARELTGDERMAQEIWCEELEDGKAWNEEINYEEILHPGAWWLDAASSMHNFNCLNTEEEARLEEEASIASSAEFMRGAHAHPHSSEVELSTEAAGELRDAELWRMSSEQLLHSVRLHSRALGRLLRETEQRQATLRGSTRRPRSYAIEAGSFEDRPTRDGGAGCPPAALARDRLVAGSRGRGRGRLAAAPRSPAAPPRPVTSAAVPGSEPEDYVGEVR